MTTRFGVHTPSDYYWVPPDGLIAWCEDAKRHGVGCVTVWANDHHQVEFCKALIDHGIEVIYRPGENLIPCQFIGGIYEKYRHVGVKMCQYFNEPNLYAEWADGHRLSPEKFAEHWAKACWGLKALGFTPVIPPLSPGGNLWHPEFFHRMMGWWNKQGMLPELVQGCILGIHNRPTTNHPDATGVCSFEGYRYYRQWMVDIMGFSLPMVAPEAGYEPPNVSHDWEKWKEWNLELIRRFRPDHPKYVGDDFLWHCFWIYHDSGSIWDQCGLVENWFYAQDHGGDRTTNLWRALQHEPWDVTPDPVDRDPVDPIDPDPVEPDPIDGDIVFVGLSEKMIDALTLCGPDNPDEAHWKVTRVEIQPQTDNMSAWLLLPYGTLCPGAILSWPNNEAVMHWKGLDLLSPPGCKQGGFEQPMHHAWGSYGMRVNGNSETLFGFGLYGSGLEMGHTGHHPVMITYKLVYPGDPDPDPDPDPYTLKRRLEQAPHGFEDLRAEIEAISDMATLNDEARRDEAGNPLFHQIQSIVVHHSGYSEPHTAMSTAAQAIKEGEPTIEYHFCVDATGLISWTSKLVHVTRHTYGLNEISIAVCALGNYEHKDPPEEQMAAMRFVIAALYEFVGQGWGAFRLLGLVPHREIRGNSTVCPGRLWPLMLWSGSWRDFRGHL